MNYWILKTEPSTYSMDDLIKNKKACWDGVRNFQARKNLRSMEIGDQAIIYHSGDDKAAIGLAKVVKVAYQDPTTKEDWSAVDLVPIKKFDKTVTLSTMKSDSTLKEMSLVRQSRLSVCPITNAQFDRLLKLAEL